MKKKKILTALNLLKVDRKNLYEENQHLFSRVMGLTL